MHPYSPLAALMAVLLAYATSALLTRRFGAPAPDGRYATIDGLRGYLAYFVFLHHVAIWWGWRQTGVWDAPESNLFIHFGKTSVAMFFMITGFLFFSKLLSQQGRPMDWTKLFVGRVTRLAPLYLFAMACLFTVVVVRSAGVLNEPAPRVAREVLQWLLFTVVGAPEINALPETPHITAGVTWSLRYEWFFYLALPVIGLLVRVKASRLVLAMSLGSLAVMPIWQPKGWLLATFAGGMLAAWLVRKPQFQQWARTPWATLVTLACLTLTVVGFRHISHIAPVLMLTTAFALIAGGNSLFGLLLTPTSRTLGETAYGLYLLHGLLLYVTFTYIAPSIPVIGSEVIQHWLIALALTPVLVVMTWCAYRWIEVPGMRLSTPILNAVRQRTAFLKRQPA